MNDRYRVVRQLGSGGLAETWEVQDIGDGDKLKVLKVLRSNNSKTVELFKREAEVLLKLNCPGIPRGEEGGYFLFRKDADKPLHCLVMEKVDGLDLKKWFKQKNQKPISQDLALDWLKQLVQILAKVHDLNYFHRDIKPSNIMLRSNGQLVLIDFGAVRQLTDTFFKRLKNDEVTAIGTLMYMAPEQIRCKAVPQSDFFALGRTFVYLLTGKLPTEFKEDWATGKFEQNWRESAPQVSNPLADLIDELMAPLPEQRPQTARDILERLEIVSIQLSTEPILKELPMFLKFGVKWILEREAERLAQQIPLSGRAGSGKSSLINAIRSPLIIGLLVVAGLSGIAWWWIYGNNTGSPCLYAYGTSGKSNRRSLGEEILVSELASKEKRAGVKAFAKCDFKTAETRLKESLMANRNDPEALIYLHNAKAAARGGTLKIVASVPIGENLNFAQEVLRGVAQAQQEINSQGGINGKQLLVEIANDDNKIKIVEKLADEFVADTKILAVVGHNSSSASVAGAPIYETGSLVMVSATSGSETLSDFQDYVFRIVPNASIYAEALASRAKNAPYNGKYLHNIAICADSQDSYSKSFKVQFTADIYRKDVKVAHIECDLADPSFNASYIYKAIPQEVDGLLLSASYKNLRNAISMIKANQKKLPLFATRNMYVQQTIKDAGEAAEGMLLAVPWLPDAGTDFFTEAYQLWDAKVNWRTAMAYDAAGVIIKGLKNGNSRLELQEELSNPDFFLQGATGKVRFLPGGDRLVEDPENEVKFVTVGEKRGSGGEHEFEPLD